MKGWVLFCFRIPAILMPAGGFELRQLFSQQNGAASMLRVSYPRETPSGRNPEIFRWWFQLPWATPPQTISVCFFLDRPNCGSCICHRNGEAFFLLGRNSLLLEMFCLSSLECASNCLRATYERFRWNTCLCTTFISEVLKSWCYCLSGQKILALYHLNPP